MDVTYHGTSSGIVKSLRLNETLSFSQIPVMAALYQFTEHGIIILDATLSFYEFFRLSQYDIIDPILYCEFNNP